MPLAHSAAPRVRTLHETLHGGRHRRWWAGAARTPRVTGFWRMLGLGGSHQQATPRTGTPGENGGQPPAHRASREIGRLMPRYAVGCFAGSLSSTTINRAPSRALLRAAPEDLDLVETPIRDLPLYSATTRTIRGSSRTQGVPSPVCKTCPS